MGWTILGVTSNVMESPADGCRKLSLARHVPHVLEAYCNAGGVLHKLASFLHHLKSCVHSECIEGLQPLTPIKK